MAPSPRLAWLSSSTVRILAAAAAAVAEQNKFKGTSRLDLPGKCDDGENRGRVGESHERRKADVGGNQTTQHCVGSRERAAAAPMCGCGWLAAAPLMSMRA